MEIDLLRQLEELVGAFGVKTLRIGSGLDGELEYDQGLRRFLQYPNNIRSAIRDMEQYYEEKTLYITRDSFEECYQSFLLPEKYWRGTKKEFLLIGPYITEEPEYIVGKLTGRNPFSDYLVGELREYYYSVPFLSRPDALEGVVLTLMGYLFSEREGVEIRRNSFTSGVEPENLRQEEDNSLSMAVIEERYRSEERMLEAVRTGDTEKVIEAEKAFNQYRIKPRSDDTLRNVKNLMIVWNTLLRKAVQQADVHPIYIDRLSEGFARRIEACAHVNDLRSLSHEMMRKYCLLVRNHSLGGHSALIRDSLNYIDFHIREPLSLKRIAEEVGVSPSYLSAQFKKETGKTLTDYINEKRIHDSLVLLATTELPIQEVAERVGIYDENYYARLFKKYQNQTAKQYRAMIRLKEK